jgi:hypothetical protein
MALESTQPLIKISTSSLPGGKGRPTHKAANRIANLLADCLENVGASTSHNSMGLHGLLQGYRYLLYNFST